MKKWKDLKSKGEKYERICCVTVPSELYNPINEQLKLYKKNKHPIILEEIRTYLIKHKAKFSLENQERIDLFLM